MKLFNSQKIKALEHSSIYRRAIIVSILFFVCLGGVAITRGTIRDRIDRQNIAINSIEGIAPINFKSPEYTIEDGNKSTYYPPVNNFSINNFIFEDKIIGNQKIKKFKANFSYTLDTSTFNVVPHSYLNITIPKNTDRQSVQIKFDNQVFGLTPDFIYLNDSNNSSNSIIKIPDEKITGKNIIISYTSEGINYIDFDKTQILYNVLINPGTKNIRISPSNFGTVNNDGSVNFNIVQNDNHFFRGDDLGDPKIQFLQASDDINFVDRITKYSILVIFCIFALIFLFDLFSGLSFNYLQYLLIGASLGLFYLLTLSIGEHTGYTVSYLLASLVTMCINGWYFSGITNSYKQGLLMALVIGICYSAVYFILKAGQGMNLLTGTVILYVILILFMFVTRKVNHKN